MMTQIKTWHHPTLIPMPVLTAGVSRPVINLNGIWKINHDLPAEYWQNSVDFSAWADTAVPGDQSETLVRRRNRGKVEFAYKLRLDIPADFAGQRILLRFEGSHGFTRVWIDGHFIMLHRDGFISWDCDLTEHVVPGQSSILTVGLENHNDEVSGFNQGGLVRAVKLVAVPAAHLTRLHGETAFDSSYQNAVLKVLLGTRCPADSSVQVALALYAPSGERVGIGEALLLCGGGQTESEMMIPVAAPRKWDAEHPDLYRLEASLIQDGIVLEKAERLIGFRQIKIDGNIFRVNGDEVKLRGACRHDISARHGRTVTHDEMVADFMLFKEANVNYIRTSHYPPTEDFLDLCDRYGMYVEDEVGLAFIGRSLKYTEKSPAFTERYLTFFSEFVERDRSHPSVIIWSLANESFYGPNFGAINIYAHAEDPSRPTKFSYPMTMQEEDIPVDIWSIHYSNYNADLARKLDNVSVGFSPGYDRPVLHDECTHVPCYNRDEHRRDPAVRTFWGVGLQKFWDNIWQTPGALGGAIWAGIDETSYSSPGRLLEWGIMDVWRRAKPELWMTKKAYSPIRITCEEFVSPGLAELGIEVENRFNHTNFNEIAIHWAVDGDSGVIRGFDLRPRQTGILRLPARQWQDGSSVDLKFVDPAGMTVDEFRLAIAPPVRQLPAPGKRTPRFRCEQDSIVVEGGATARTQGAADAGADFRVIFSRSSGLITSAQYLGEQLIRSGPFLHMAGILLPPWQLDEQTVSQRENEVIVLLRGHYGDAVAVTFEVSIDGAGLITTQYTIGKLGIELPQAMKIRVGVHPGGLDELGVSYLLDGSIDRLSWDRKGPHSVWPQDHISRNQGVARRDNNGADPIYGDKPSLPWSEDMKSYMLYGKYDPGLRGTNDFRSMKHHFYSAAAYAASSLAAVCAESDGRHSIRLEAVPDPASLVDDRDPAIRYTGTWYALEDAGNHLGTETCSNTPGDTAEYTFRGTGIVWIGPVDVINGIARVYVDGQLRDDHIDQRVEGLEFAGSSIGFDKKYGKPLFSICGLPMGEHTLRLEVAGLKADDAQNSYVSVDCFRVLGQPMPDPVKLIINSDYNYPRLAWGNFIREAVQVRNGQSDRVFMRLTGRPASAASAGPESDNAAKPLS